MTNKSTSIAFLIAALALVPLMPSGDSIWIDEAQTWRYARHTSFQEFLSEFRLDRSSEIQMPLGMGLAWVFAKISGVSEYALRAPNMIYSTGAILCFFLLGRRENIPAMPLVLAIQPFLWFYSNEARPYALQIFGGSLLITAVYFVFKGNISSPKWVMCWGFGSLLSTASSMLGGIPTAASSLIICIELARNKFRFTVGQLLLFVCFTTMLLILGVYYITTLLSGAGGAKVWSVGSRNLLISGAEFMGFAGMLPPRQEVRELVKAGFSASIDLRVLLFPGLLAALYVALGTNWLRQFNSTPRWIWACTAVLIGSCILLTIAATSVGFPFWGRHLAAAFPAFAVFAGWMAHLGWRSKGVMPFASVAYGATLLCSSVLLRISDVHAKDDYREATRLATAAVSAGKVVWWAADPPAASYYIPEMQSLIANKKLILTFGPEASPIDRRPDPQMIILSKPDLYDPNGTIRNRGEKEGLKCKSKLKGFEVWQK